MKTAYLASIMAAFLAVGTVQASPPMGCPPGHQNIDSCSDGSGGNGGSAPVNVGVDVASQNTAISSSQSSATGGTSVSSNTNVLGGAQVGDTTSNSVSQGGSVLGSGNSSSISQGGAGGSAEGGVASASASVEEGAFNVSIVNNNTPDEINAQNVDGAVQLAEGAEMGTARSEGNNTSITSVYSAPRIPVASAAPSFSSICTSGAAGQTKGFGFSLAVNSDVCTHLMVADAYMAVGRVEEALKHVDRASHHANVRGFMGRIRSIVTIGIL